MFTNNAQFQFNGGRAAPTLTAAEQAVSNLPDLVGWMRADQPAGAHSRLSFRDLANSMLWAGQGAGRFGADINGKPVYGAVANTGRVSGARLVADFTLPPSYTVYAAFKAEDLSANTFVVTSDDNTGNRFYLYCNTFGALVLDHGAASGNGSATSATGQIVAGGVYVVAASFDSVALRASVFRNSLTPLINQSANITGPHKAWPKTAIAGHTGTGGGAAVLEALICNNPHHLTAYADRLATVMGYMAARAGVTLS